MTLPQAIVATAPSGWPMPLMLDETWLRAHRALVHALEADGLWPDSATQRRFMEAQQTEGEHLRDSVLFGVLGPTDFAHLGSESIFGASNGRFRRRLPFVLAFGYEVGQGLYAMAYDGIGKRGEEVGEASAIFNLGISVFDLLADTDATQFGELSTLVDAPRLRGILEGSLDVEELTPAGREPETPEVRILLKLIASFFRRLHTIGQADEPAAAETRGQIAVSLLAAHTAELQSAGSLVAEDLLAVSEAKSTLPFTIIGDLARLAATDGEVPGRSVESLVDHVKAIYWLTDDLADVVTDLQTGALNSLVARSGGVPHHERESARDYPVLARLLASRDIEETADAIRLHLRAADLLVRQTEPSRRDGFGLLLACYVRDWIE